MSSDRLKLKATIPLYTIHDLGRMLNIPVSTLGQWIHGDSESTGDVLVTHMPVKRGSRQPSIPFIGLAEAFVLAAFRRAGVPMQRIRPALTVLAQTIGLEHALASRRLFTDGAEILYDMSQQSHVGSVLREGIQHLVIVRNGQQVFRDIVAEYLHCITWDSDGYPEVIRLPAYSRADVIVDMTRAFGQPIVQQHAIRVQDILDRFVAGEDLHTIAEDYGLAQDVVEEIVRVASRWAS